MIRNMVWRPTFIHRDIGRVYRAGEQLEFGIVGINEGIISEMLLLVE